VQGVIGKYCIKVPTCQWLDTLKVRFWRVLLETSTDDL
jgi:hypothetical protein